LKTFIWKSSERNMGAGKGSHNILPYVRGDEAPVLSLLSTAMGEAAATPRTEAFWKWKHFDNPFGNSYGLCAWDGQKRELISLRMLMRWTFETSSGEVIKAVRAVDTATRPGYRRRGLFSTLTTKAVDDLSAEGVHFIFNTPNAKSLPGYLKLGWGIVSEWPMYIRVMRPARFLFNVALKRKNTACAMPPWNSFFKNGILSWSSFKALYGDNIGKIVDAWEDRRTRKALRTRKNLSYIDWRYGCHPSLTYGVFPVENAKGLAAFAVLRPNIRYASREVVLTEMFLKDADKGLAGRLIGGLTRNINADYIICHFAEGSFEKTLLKQSSFFRVPRKGMTFTVRILNDKGPDPLRADNWDLSLGDLEVF
jgi:hypothetical protein